MVCEKRCNKLKDLSNFPLQFSFCSSSPYLVLPHAPQASHFLSCLLLFCYIHVLAEKHGISLYVHVCVWVVLLPLWTSYNYSWPKLWSIIYLQRDLRTQSEENESARIRKQRRLWLMRRNETQIYFKWQVGIQARAAWYSVLHLWNNTSEESTQQKLWEVTWVVRLCSK